LCAAAAAVAQGTSVDIIKLLIKAGADVNAVDSEGRTALCIATETRSSAIAE